MDKDKVTDNVAFAGIASILLVLIFWVLGFRLFGSIGYEGFGFLYIMPGFSGFFGFVMRVLGLILSVLMVIALVLLIIWLAKKINK